MINFDNHNIIEISYNSHNISRVYGCDGRLVFGEEPTPPVYTDKLTYSISGNTYIMPCNGNSEIKFLDVMYDLERNGYSMQSISAITSIVVGGCVTTLKNLVFAECYLLTSATIPNSVTTIESSAFKGCNTLKSISLPRVNQISQATFEGCYDLSSVTFSTRTTSIGVNAFYDCLSLVDITIPSGVTSIGNDAFRTAYWSSKDRDRYNKMNYLAANRVVRCLPTTPPSLGDNVFSIISGEGVDIASYKIYVPSESLNAYKTASGWNVYANRIFALQ